MNDEALLNFGYMHIKKTRDAVFAIAKARYGKDPKRLYFSGGSTGGREGLTAATRWPNDYDGISTAGRNRGLPVRAQSERDRRRTALCLDGKDGVAAAGAGAHCHRHAGPLHGRRR